MGTFVTRKSTYFLFPTRSELDEGSVRLDPGYNSDNSIHRVEILYDGRWGTVCSTSWEVEDATVVCSAFGGDSPDIVDSSSLR